MGRTLESLARLGRELLESGADSRVARVGVERVGRALCGSADSLISYTNIIVSADADGEGRRTYVTGVPGLGVDMTRLAILGRYTESARRSGTNLEELQATLRRTEAAKPPYPAWLTVLAVAVGCGAFSRLLGGSFATLGVAALAAGLGFTLRRLLAGRDTNPNAATVLCAVLSGAIAGVACWVSADADPSIALTAGVIYLVPGVPMVNAVEDFLHGHMAVGAGRALQAVLSLLSIGVGLLLAVALTGVPL